jgi:hypothetical protein
VTLGPAAATANALLDAIGNATNYTADAAFWVQLHTAEPGAAGTTAVAGNATRKQVSFGTPAGGVMANDTTVTWTTGEVDTAEDYTHFSGWSLVTGGTFRISGLITAAPVIVGNEFVFPVGAFTITIPIAA